MKTPFDVILFKNKVKMKQHPTHCPFCSGLVESSKTTFTVDLNTGVVVVRNIPAAVCSQCGEEWIDNATARKLERLVDDARSRGLQVEVLAMGMA